MLLIRKRKRRTKSKSGTNEVNRVNQRPWFWGSV
jgi:hypothetical protein